MQILIKSTFTLILLFGIFVIWTNTVNFKDLIESPFKKIFHLNAKVEIPRFQGGVINLMRNYQKGLEVYGIEWSSDFQECKFIFDNLTQTTEITDFQVDIQFPAGLVYYEIQQSYGFDDLQAYVNIDDIGIAQDKQIREVIKTYSNHLFIKATKIYPSSHLTMKLILKPALSHNNGFIKYDFNYINENNKKVLNDWVYLMPYHVEEDFLFFNVEKETVKGKYDYNLKLIPDRPMGFTKDGKIE